MDLVANIYLWVRVLLSTQHLVTQTVLLAYIHLATIRQAADNRAWQSTDYRTW